MRCLLVAAVVLAHQAFAVHDEGSGLDQVVRMLSIPREFEAANGFAWSNCGGSSEAGQIRNLTLSPDPVRLPGSVTVSVGADLADNLQAPIQLDLKLKKKIGFWITIPCVDGVGSCIYEDVCALLTTVTCPPDLAQYGINCRCPVNKGSYYIPQTTLKVTLPPDVPSWLENGNYQIEARLRAGGRELACVQMTVALST